MRAPASATDRHGARQNPRAVRLDVEPYHYHPLKSLKLTAGTLKNHPFEKGKTSFLGFSR